MKKLVIVLGAFLLLLIVAGVVGVLILGARGRALDNESKAYADTAIPAIVTNWSEKQLLDRSSAEFKNAIKVDQLDRLFRWVSSLGRLKTCEPALGQAGISFTPQTGKVISAQYTARAQFEGGEATITLGLIKHDDEWQILRFDVHSPQLVPP